MTVIPLNKVSDWMYCVVSGLREGKRYNIDGVLVLVIYSNPEEGGTGDSGEGKREGGFEGL